MKFCDVNDVGLLKNQSISDRNFSIEDSYKILSYNIAGMRGKSLNFFHFIRGYDVFYLTETFLEKDAIDNFVKFFKGFNLHWEPATRSSNHGRAKGGTVLGYKAALNCFLKFERMGNKILIKSNFDGREYYVLPAYLSGGSYLEWENNFGELCDTLELAVNKCFLLLGDFNCRIAEEQKFSDNILLGDRVRSVRVSKDNTINAKGKRFIELCDNNSLIILNGRVDGDEYGELTFVGGAGASVIDLCCVSLECINMVKSVRVGEEEFSDHLPLEIKIFLNRNFEMGKVIPLLPKLLWHEEGVSRYQSELRNLCLLNNELEEDVNNVAGFLVQSIYRAAGRMPDCSPRQGTVFKQKWFDRECMNARKRLFILLGGFRKNSCEILRQEYIRARSNFKLLCKRKRLDFASRVIAKITNAKGGRVFWEGVREFRTKSFKCDTEIKPEDWVRHFRNLLNVQSNLFRTHYAAPSISDRILDSEIEMMELKAVLKKSKDNKAPGLDRVPYEFYKRAPVEFLNRLLNFYNVILEKEKVPVAFTKSIIFPLYKKGDITVVDNYRGISFCDVLGKIFTGILLNRLEKFVYENKVLSEYQAGFRRGYSTTDNIFNLCSIIDLFLAKERGKLFCFFVDFKAAFDSIDREALFYKLFNLGVSNKFINILRGLYKDTESYVWCPGGLTEGFRTINGLKQGCLLSPLLFSLFIDDLQSNLGGGVNIDDLNIKILLYADDVVIMSSDAGLLQDMINNLEMYCERWNLIVNLSKSKIMVFRKGGRLKNSENWRFKGEAVEVVRSYKYLGVTLTPKLSFACHFKDRVATSKLVVNSTWSNLFKSNDIPLRAKWAVFEAVCRSVVCYGAQVWGFKGVDELEGFQRFCLKRMLGIPKVTPNYAVYLETGVDIMRLHVLNLHFQYVLKVLDLPDSRLPRRLASAVIERREGWFKEWIALAERYGCDFDPDPLARQQWGVQLKIMSEKIRTATRDHWVQKANNSCFHAVYPRLNWNLGGKCYLTGLYNRLFAGIIFKARTEMLPLNNQPYRDAGQRICSLCNSGEVENVMHFLGRCAVLREIRVRWFGVAMIGDEEILISYLNGYDWYLLVGYLREALKYRNYLVEQFNY